MGSLLSSHWWIWVHPRLFEPQSKFTFHRFCQLLAINAHKMAPRTTPFPPKDPWDSPQRVLRGLTCESLLVWLSKPPSIECTPLRWRLVSYCRTTSASTAPCTSRRMCCPTHCASYCAPCQSLLQAISKWSRSPPSSPLRYTPLHQATPKNIRMFTRNIAGFSG